MYVYSYIQTHVAGNAFSGFAVGPLTLSAFGIFGTSLLEIDEQEGTNVEGVNVVEETA